MVTGKIIINQCSETKLLTFVAEDMKEEDVILALTRCLNKAIMQFE